MPPVSCATQRDREAEKQYSSEWTAEMTSKEVPDEQTSDLIDQVHHEHAHLRRLFDDLAASFAEIAAGEVGEKNQREVVSAASEELEVALDDMLEHFDQEEEVFFIEIEKRFPELKPRIEALVEAHEEMTQRTRWLHKQLGKSPEELARDLEVVVDVLRSMAQLVDDHTQEETALFDDVLKKIPAGERRGLLEKMRQI